MSWILIAIIANIIFAVGNIADKFLLQKYITSSKTYAFLIGIFSLLIFALAPWYLQWPGWTVWSYNLLVGALAPLAMILLYKALKEGEASQMITLLGTSIPIFTLILSIFFLGESFSVRQWIAIIFLILGAVFFSWVPDVHDLWHKVLIWFKVESINHRLGIAAAIGAGFFFSLFFIGNKFLFSQQSFMSAFIWMRLGTALVTLLILVPPAYRREVFNNLKNLKNGRTSFLFFGNQIIGGGGLLLQSYAIALGSVAIVNALQGVQYVVLVILTTLISIFYPKIIKEKVSEAIVVKKVIAILLITVGLYLIVL